MVFHMLLVQWKHHTRSTTPLSIKTLVTLLLPLPTVPLRSAHQTPRAPSPSAALTGPTPASCRGLSSCGNPQQDTLILQTSRWIKDAPPPPWEVTGGEGRWGKHPSFFFSPFIFISWRLITSQHCSGFCHRLT